MIDYLKMSDYEINWRVAEESGLSVDHNANATLPQTYCGYDENGCKYDWGFRDYCNNPADAWPIILENKISIHNNGIAWKAYKSDRQGAFNDTPLRAAMIVFLMMKGGEIAGV